MSKLVPEQRVDKNGRLVTKHVRPDLPQRGTAAALPAPAVSNAAQQAKDFKVVQWEMSKFPIRSGTLDKLYPMASDVAGALQLADHDEIYDLFNVTVLNDDTNGDEWPDEFASTCHFISRTGECSDVDAFDIALHPIGEYHGVPKGQMYKADEQTRQQIEDVMELVNANRFLRGVIVYAGHQHNAIKREEFMKYLCERRTKGDFVKIEPALRELEGFINFNDDEHEEPDIMENLEYPKLLELMESTLREDSTVQPKTALSMVRMNSYKVDGIKEKIEGYDGSGALVSGLL